MTPADACERRAREAEQARQRRAKRAAKRTALIARGEWPKCSLRGCERPAGPGGHACCPRHAAACKARTRARRQGYILVSDAARKLKAPAALLRDLYKTGKLAGTVVDGDFWLERQALAVWAFSRPRCVVDGCGRRALGGKAGCTQHPNNGQRRSEEGREAISQSVQKWWDSDQGRRERKLRSQKKRSAPPVIHRCEWCGETFELSARRTRTEPGRFCSRECVHESRRPELIKQIQDGRQRWRERVAAFKAETDLLDLEGVRAALPRELRRSQPAVSGHIAAGGLVATPNELDLLLFSREAVEAYASWLREHPDGRLRRFNADNAGKARWRAGTWTRQRHGDKASAREYGRLAPLLAAADEKTVGRRGLSQDKRTQIYELRKTRPDLGVRAIARIVDVGRGQVERLLNTSRTASTPSPSRKDEVVTLLTERPWLTLREIAAPRYADPPGIGADWRAVKDILEADASQFESRTGSEAVALGRHSPRAVVWGLRRNKVSRNPPLAA